MKKRKRGRRPRCVGTVALYDSGRESNVYCSWRPRALKHEVLLTDWILDFGLDLLNWKRGINTDSQYRPDAEWGNLMVEYDTGTEKKAQVQRQAKRYNDCQSMVLWVFQSKDVSRFNWIQEVAKTNNTLLMLVGSDQLFDLNGNAMSVRDFVGSMLKNTAA